MFGLPNGAEWFILLVLILVFFGAPRAPQARRQVGRLLADQREPATTYRESRTDSVDWLLFGGVLALTAVGCIAALVAAQAGWV